MLTAGNASTTGSIQHEGVRYDSNTLNDTQMREVLEIPAPETSDGDQTSEPREAAEPEPPPAIDAPAKEAHPAAATDKAAPKPKKNPQERIDRLTFEREEAKREAARVRDESLRQMAELRAEIQREFAKVQRPEPQAQTPPSDGEPKFDDFANDADPYASWMRAVSKWEARQEFKAQQEQAQAQFHQQQQHQREQQRQHAEHQRLHGWTQRMETAFAANPSLRESIENMPVLPRPMMDVIVDSEIPDRILHHLVQHPEEQARIVALHPLRQFRELSRIEYQLEQAASLSGPAAPAKPKTHANPPISPVSGSHAAPSSGGEPGPDASYEEHRAYWNKVEADQRKSRR